MNLILFEIILLAVGILPFIANSKRGDTLYRFKRNFFQARPTACVAIGSAVFYCIYFLIIQYHASYSVALELISVLAVLLLIIIFSIIDYVVSLEGAYSNGLLIRGMFYKWKTIKSFETVSENQYNYIIKIIFISKKSRRAYRNFRIQRDYWTNLKPIIKKQIKQSSANK